MLNRASNLLHLATVRLVTRFIRHRVNERPFHCKQNDARSDVFMGQPAVLRQQWIILDNFIIALHFAIRATDPIFFHEIENAEEQTLCRQMY